MRNKFKAAVAVLLMLVGLGAVTAAPAYAVDPFYNCHGAGVICLAEHRGGTGVQYGPWTWGPPGSCYNLPASFNDKTSALWNKYGITPTAPLQFTLYQDVGCRGGYLYTWGPQAYVLWIGNVNNDRASSGCLGPRHGTNTPPEGYCPRG